MSKQANPTAIGGFVLGALALIIIAVLVFSSGVLFQTEQRVTYFPGTVRGLSVGARVDFQGVQVGEVTDIKLNYNSQENQFNIPVYYNLWPDKVSVLGEVPEQIEGKTPSEYLIEDLGLRAQLISTSLVTGQYIISLSLRPDTPVDYVNDDEIPLEIPAIESSRDRLGGLLQDLDLNVLVNNLVDTLDSLNQLVSDPALRSLALHSDQTMIEARQFLSTLNADSKTIFNDINSILDASIKIAEVANQELIDFANKVETMDADLSDLIRDVDEQVESIGKSTVSTLQSVEDMVAEDSSIRHDLGLLLREGAGAARSLRILADYLEQNPDALLKGRYGTR